MAGGQRASQKGAGDLAGGELPLGLVFCRLLPSIPKATWEGEGGTSYRI